MVHGVDTDVSPYDSGSYASSTAYLTGMAAVKACEAMREKIMEKGAEYLERSVDEVDFDGSQVFSRDGSSAIRLKDIGNRVMCNNGKALEAVSYTHLDVYKRQILCLSQRQSFGLFFTKYIFTSDFPFPS